MTSQDPRQIIALGGGGFSDEPDNPALDIYIIKQASVARPKVCLIPTASGDAMTYLIKFYQAFSNYDCHPSHLPLFDRTPDIRALLLDQDIIFVGGGNTRSMLATWAGWDVGSILREAWSQGVILAGISAGAICWFEQGITDSGAEGLAVLDCLGLLPGSCCPHYDSETERRLTFHRFLSQSHIQPGYALDDGAALHFRGLEVVGTVASRETANAFRLEVIDGLVTEKRLPVKRLTNE